MFGEEVGMKQGLDFGEQVLEADGQGNQNYIRTPGTA